MVLYTRLLLLLVVLITLSSADGDTSGISDPSSVKSFEKAFTRMCDSVEEAKDGKGEQGKCPLYKKEKGKGLNLVRTMDQGATAAVAQLRKNEDFKAWVNSKPVADVKTATLLRKAAFRAFKKLDERAKLIESNYNAVSAAMFGRARGLVANRVSFTRAMEEYKKIVRLEVAHGVNDINVRIAQIKKEFESQSGLLMLKSLLNLYLFVTKTIRDVSKLIHEMSKMTRLGNNEGFKMYRALVGNSLRAELMSYLEDMLGGSYSDGTPREGVLTVKNQYNRQRQAQLKVLANLTDQESEVMSIESLHQEFPIPDTVKVNALVCAEGSNKLSCTTENKCTCDKMVVSTVPESTRNFTVWNRWGSSSPDMPKALKAALNPREGGAQWNCMRITGPSEKMQSSYECTLLDYGPGGLGFVGFKGTTRLVPLKGKKTCVKWARTKTVKHPAEHLCCPGFQARCDEGSCEKVYNREAAKMLYEKTKEKCTNKFKECNATGITTDCLQDRQDCNIEVTWFKPNITMTGKSTFDAISQVAENEHQARIDARTYCQALWKNSRNMEDATDERLMPIGLFPYTFAYVAKHFPAENTSGVLPAGVLAKPFDCKDTSNRGAFWPAPKWGTPAPTRVEYCLSGCQELFPQPAGCPKIGTYVTFPDRKKITVNVNGKAERQNLCMNMQDKYAAYITRPAWVDGKLKTECDDRWYSRSKHESQNYQWDQPGCSKRDAPKAIVNAAAERAEAINIKNIKNKVTVFGDFDRFSSPKLSANLKEGNQLSSDDIATANVETDEDEVLQAWMRAHQPYHEAGKRSKLILKALKKAEAKLHALKLTATKRSRRSGFVMDFGIELKESQASGHRAKWCGPSCWAKKAAAKATEVKNKATEVANKATAKATEVANKATEVKNKATAAAVKTAKELTDKAATAVKEGKDKAAAAVKKAKELTDKAAAAAVKTAKELKDKTAAAAAAAIKTAKELTDKAATKAKEIKDKIAEKAEKAKELVIEKAEKAKELVKEKAEKLKNPCAWLKSMPSWATKICDKISEAANLVKSLKDKLVKIAKEAAAKVLSAFTDKLDKLKKFTIKVAKVAVPQRESDYIQVPLLDPKVLVTTLLSKFKYSVIRYSIFLQSKAYNHASDLTREVAEPKCEILEVGTPCKEAETSSPIKQPDTLMIDLETSLDDKKHCKDYIEAGTVRFSKIVHCPLKSYEYMLSNVTFSNDQCMSSKACQGVALEGPKGDPARMQAEGWCTMY